MAPRAILRDVEPFSAAERQRRYRDRLASQGRKAPRGKRKSLFQSGEFVAIDGEGFSEGPEIVCRVESSGAEYRAREHFYALLSASDGHEIYAPHGRLSAAQCLDFLIDVKARNPKAILVCFGGSYDVTQMLAYDLSREQIASLLKSASLGARQFASCEFGRYEYRLEYRPRKALTIWRWKKGAKKYQELKNGGRKLVNCESVTLWDVWGFFQDSFKGVLRKWVPDDPDYQFISRMKEGRAIFTRDQIDEIRTYNAAELRCLVAVMNKVRDAVNALSLSLSRWDGAGAIASAMSKANNVRDHKEETPPDVFEAARYAYSGGHIEVCKIGHHRGRVHHYDVNSAYPDQFRRLPSLAGGRWQRGGAGSVPPPGFTLVHVAFHYLDGMPFYPLFYREENGRIIYPPRGTGWYWFDEFKAAQIFARKFGCHSFKVLGWHHMMPADPDARPFAWIEGYYARRQWLVEEARRTGIPNGEEKILKLGYNACYGKTAQQVGARVKDGELEAPAYFQLEWAGFVTAGCRAKLMQAAMQKPHAIIGFATDGIFSTEPLDLPCPSGKPLGMWEYAEHAGITMVMPGVYWLHEDDGKDVLHSRGFDKSQMSGAETVLAAWKRRQSRLTVKLSRLIGLGSALTSETFWRMRGMFVSTTKELALNGDNSKRYPAMLYRMRPDQGLCDTLPRDHFDDLFCPLEELHSAIYPLEWIKAEREDASDWADIEAARMA